MGEILVSQEVLLSRIAAAEARVEVAERACAVRDAALQEIYDYVDRARTRARRAYKALKDSPDPLDKERAAARSHEISSVAGIVKILASKPGRDTASEGWLSPKQARQAHEALLGCLRRLREQQSAEDNQMYQNALALLGATIS